MSRDGTLPPGVEHGDPDAPWNAREPEEYPCVDCGEDVGEEYSWRLGSLPASSCEECSEPLCRTCQDKAAATLDVDAELCAKCAAKEQPPTPESAGG